MKWKKKIKFFQVSASLFISIEMSTLKSCSVTLQIHIIIIIITILIMIIGIGFWSNNFTNFHVFDVLNGCRRWFMTGGDNIYSSIFQQPSFFSSLNKIYLFDMTNLIISSISLTNDMNLLISLILIDAVVFQHPFDVILSFFCSNYFIFNYLYNLDKC